MERITNKEKAEKITIKLEGEIGTSPHSRQAIEESIFEMAQWKDEQMKNTLIDFMHYLDRRDFFHDDLCFDIEHQVETFIELQNRNKTK